MDKTRNHVQAIVSQKLFFGTKVPKGAEYARELDQAITENHVYMHKRTKGTKSCEKKEKIAM